MGVIRVLGVVCLVLCVWVGRSQSLYESYEGPTARPFIKVADGPFDIDTLVGRRRAAAAPNLPPSTIKTFYNIDQSMTAGAGKTIGIVVAYAHPAIESDLAIFSAKFGLPACTTANGCFTRVNQTGGTAYTGAKDANWAMEAGLDVQWTHAMAPGAKILYVEANSASSKDMQVAVAYASKNADYVSMSFGFNETTTFESTFKAAPTTSFFAASGDSGAGVHYPSSSPFVVAVGGTTLYANSGVFDSEVAWKGSGGGCSAMFNAPAAQLSTSTSLCGTKRAVPDVAANADLASGVFIIVSENCSKAASECAFLAGGTSLASPIVAAHAAVRGIYVNMSMLYAGPNALGWSVRDVTSGNNGYAAAAGYDLVTGMGALVSMAATTTTTTTAPGTSTTTTVAQGTTTASNTTTTTTTTKAQGTTTTTTTPPTTTTAPTTTTDPIAISRTTTGDYVSTTTGISGKKIFWGSASSTHPTTSLLLATTIVCLLLSVILSS